MIALTGCGTHHQPARAAYIPLAEAERDYGPLITAGNHPSPQQSGTGERVGLFRDTDGTVWGLPVILASGGSTLVCAPPTLRQAEATDYFPAGATIIGATSEPTGWRGGTGDLELVMRDAQGSVQWQSVHGSQLATGAACWAPATPGPPQRLSYYRLMPRAR